MAADSSTDAPAAMQTIERSVSPAVNGKRKRDEEIIEEKPALPNPIDQEELCELIDDLLLVLKSSFSTAADIINHSIISVTNGDSSSKRAKLSASATPPASDSTVTITTIAKQVTLRAYKDLDELVTDFDTAVDATVKESDEATETTNGTGHVRAPRSKIAQDARALQAEVHELIASEKHRASRTVLSSVSGNATPAEGDKLKGSQGLKVDSTDTSGRDILSSFGADYRGRDSSRQWFSTRIDLEKPTGVDPVSSALLPNGVIVTNVKPMGRPAYRKQAKTQTLGDLIPSPAPAVALKPPQPPTSDMTRSQVVEWHKPASQPPSHRPTVKNSWSDARLPRGNWLAYYSRADAEESNAEKRIKRDRTLSGGEKPDPAEQEFLLQTKLSRTRAKKSSLFKSAFSSFAPSHDDTNALIPASSAARIWWDKKGSEMYDEYLDPNAGMTLEEKLQALDPHLEDSEEALTEEDLTAITRAVEAGEFDGGEEYGKGMGGNPVDDLLGDISEQIETLVVYQQERLKTVVPPGKQATLQHPSEAEAEIYELMKLQLAGIVSALPPAALLRLDHDKLGKLNISTAVPLPVPSYPGIIDTTDRPQQARPSSAATANTPARQHLPQQTSTPQPARHIQQPRSAYAGQTSAPMGRPAMPQQYSVQQPGRYANHYPTQQAQATPVPNGYQRNMPSTYQQQFSPYAAAQGTPTRHPNQYTAARPPPPATPMQSYQSRPGPYPPMPNNQIPPAGRAGSPQRPPSYSMPQNRPQFPAGQGSPMSAGHAASIYRPPSASASSSQQATIGGLIDISPEERQQIARRAQDKQQENTGAGSGGPQMPQQKQLAQSQGQSQVQPQNVAYGQMPAQAQTQVQGQAQARPQTPNMQRAPIANGIAQGSPGSMQGVQQTGTPQKVGINGVNGA